MLPGQLGSGKLMGSKADMVYTIREPTFSINEVITNIQLQNEVNTVTAREDRGSDLGSSYGDPEERMERRTLSGENLLRVWNLTGGQSRAGDVCCSVLLECLFPLAGVPSLRRHLWHSTRLEGDRA